MIVVRVIRIQPAFRLVPQGLLALRRLGDGRERVSLAAGVRPPENRCARLLAARVVPLARVVFGRLVLLRDWRAKELGF